MSTEVKKQIQLEIAHVLFIDIVGYSKRSINEQHAAIDELNEVVRNSDQFQKADASDRLIKIPTGDGMALVFYTTRRRLRNARSKSVVRLKNTSACNFAWEYIAVQ